MIVHISTNSSSMSMRITRHEGIMYICLDDVISLSSSKTKFKLSNENIEEIFDIIGEKEFIKLDYGSVSEPLPSISYDGLKKLIDCSNIKDYLHKDDLVIIYDYITRNKSKINKIMNDEIQTKEVLTKPKIENTHLNDKLKEMNYHINRIKSHLDTIIKIQDELINNK